MQLLALLSLLLAPAASFVAGPMAPRSIRPAAVSIKPQMMIEAIPDAALVHSLADTTMLLAKSGADDIIEEVFINLPLVVAGGVIAYIGAAGYLEDDDVAKLAAPAGAILFLALGKAGILGVAAGILAKVSLDAWNVFAGVVLKGALLIYK